MKSQNITSKWTATETAKAGMRWYDDACGTALGLELLGERWALLIVRELMFGGRRFGELRAGLPGISANVLTQRLAGLERAGIVKRELLPPPASVQLYALTPWGYEAEPVIQTLGRWAARSPDHDPTLPLSPASLMLSFRTMVDPSRLTGGPVRIMFILGPERFLARADQGGLEIVRSRSGDCDVTATSDPMTIAAIIYGGQPVADLEAAGAIAIVGDRAAFTRFARLFTLPPKADREPPA